MLIPILTNLFHVTDYSNSYQLVKLKFDDMKHLFI